MYSFKKRQTEGVGYYEGKYDSSRKRGEVFIDRPYTIERYINFQFEKV